MKKKIAPDLIIIHLVLLLFAALCIIPFITVVSISVSNEAEIARNGYSILPRGFSLKAYEYILKSPMTILKSYGVTIAVCIVGTLLSLLVMSLCAYPLSRRDFKFRNQISFYVFFTMLFNGGLVPTYIWVSKYMGMGNTFWALVLPVVVSPWYLLLLC